MKFRAGFPALDAALRGALIVDRHRLRRGDALASCRRRPAHVRRRVRRQPAGAVAAQPRDRPGAEEPVQLPRAQLGAKYECPFFGPDGKLRRRRVQASELGSAFAYEQSGNDTYLLTNEHVAAWPEVTDTFHRIDGVPEGCKRVEDKLRIVRDERDDFEPGQIVAHARRRRPAARRRDPQGEPEAHGHPLQDRQERGPAPGQRRRGARLPARRHAGGLERQGRQPLRPRSGAGLGPRRLRDRRAPLRGQLGQPRAGRVVQVAPDGARRHLPRRLQGPRRAQRRRRHRPAHRLHAQEEARPARPRRGRRPARPAPPTARAPRRRSAPAPCPCSTSAASSCAPRTCDDGTLLYHVYGRQFPLDDRRVVVIEDLPKEGAFGELGRLWVFGRPAGASGARRRWAPTSTTSWCASPTRCACRSYTASTTAARSPTPAQPTSAGTSAICRARSRATSPSPATWPRTCSTRSTACRRRAILAPRLRARRRRRLRLGFRLRGQPSRSFRDSGGWIAAIDLPFASLKARHPLSRHGLSREIAMSSLERGRPQLSRGADLHSPLPCLVRARTLSAAWAALTI